MENNHGNCEKPSRSATADGTAVAMMVLSSAIRRSARRHSAPVRGGPKADSSAAEETLQHRHGSAKTSWIVPVAALNSDER
jgi:hypothetical protein